MDRCSLCNEPLRPATEAEVCGADYVPAARESFEFFTCPACRRIYWMGSHGRNLKASLERELGPR